MAKNTSYSELRNTILVISFNQRIVAEREAGIKYQPVLIEARTDALTPEGSVLSVKSEVKLGDVVETELTNEQIYKQVYSLSPVLAKALESVLLDSVSEDMKAVDVSAVKPVKVTDIK